MTSSFAEVNIDHVLHNVQVLKSYLNPKVLQMAVVKANAYGHGAVPVSRALEPVTDWFAVVNAEEAIELRDAGIKKNILVFGPPNQETAGAYLAYNLTAVVSDLEHFEIIEDGTAYHIEFDTGMGRLGINPAQINEVKEKIKSNPKLRLSGVMTHFASADIPKHPQTGKQVKAFEEIRKAFNEIPDIVFHASNTAGILCFPEAQYDMVRHGLGMYGYDPSLVTESRLIPAMQWKSSISLCKYILKGTPVSYGATWSAPEDGYLAVIPVGYADGFRRSLGGKIDVLIEGEYYPTVGRVTMDFVMVFLRDRYFKPGTAVTLLGAKKNDADIWADQIDTIAFEILCGLHKRVKRIYTR
ncbi:MAG: alanine racemase [Balneolales bacterium]